MSAASFKEAGNKHLQAGRFDEAIKAYTEAIDLDPSDHVFYSNRSAAYLSKGDAENARLDAQDCILISPNWPKGHSRKGAALHALRRYEDAIAAFNAGLVIAPTDAGLLEGLANAKKAQEAADAAPPAGEGLFGPKMLAGLATHPKFGPKLKDPMFQMKLQMIQKNPQMMMQDPEMMELFQAILGQAGGSAQFGGEDDQPPEDEYVPPLRPTNTPPSSSSAPPSSSSYTPPPKAPEAAPKKAEPETPALAAKERGNTHYKAKEFPQAIAAYDEAIALDPLNLMFLNNKAAVYIEMGDAEKAIAICQEILEKAPTVKLSFDDRAKVYQRIAAAHLKKGDDRAAIDAYGKAQMEKYDKAIERKVKTLELELKKKAVQDYINPELGLAAKERGNAAFRDGDFPKAITEYEEAVKRDPTNAPYFNNLAAAYQKMGVFNDAKKAVEKSLELDKTYVKAWAKKGDIEFFMKEYHKAQDSYKVGLQLDPDNSLCRQGLQKTNAKVNELNYGGEHDKERTAHAMADPEIQRILSDPTIRQVLTDFQENPKFAQQALANDPDIRAKIEKLIAAGVLQVK